MNLTLSLLSLHCLALPPLTLSCFYSILLCFASLPSVRPFKQGYKNSTALLLPNRPFLHSIDQDFPILTAAAQHLESQLTSSPYQRGLWPATLAQLRLLDLSDQSRIATSTTSWLCQHLSLLRCLLIFTVSHNIRYLRQSPVSCTCCPADFPSAKRRTALEFKPANDGPHGSFMMSCSTLDD